MAAEQVNPPTTVSGVWDPGPKSRPNWELASPPLRWAAAVPPTKDPQSPGVTTSHHQSASLGLLDALWQAFVHLRCRSRSVFPTKFAHFAFVFDFFGSSDASYTKKYNFGSHFDQLFNVSLPNLGVHWPSK